MGGATSRVARMVGCSLLGGLLVQAACSGETTSSTPGTCPVGQASCQGACVDTALDPANCGGCGVICATGELCSAGQCGIGCFGGTTECGGACVDTSFNPSHCGGCGVACAEGEVCSAGGCGLDCAGGTTNCDGLCVDTKLDNSHCGGCDNVCAPDEVCSAGQCGFECKSGETLCGSQCVGIASDPAHCGACGNACAEGEVCQLGACILSCAGGTTKCGNKCVDTLIDSNNCGSCGAACVGGDVCVGGICALKCVGGTIECNGKCADTQSDPAHCGGCDQACQIAQFCSKGTCQSICGNLELCGNECADLQTSTKHCGQCDKACGQQEICKAGQCTSNLLASCNAILLGGQSKGSGLYKIDPDGGDPKNAIDVYCDMTGDGGGWTYRVHQDLLAYWSFDDNDYGNADFGGYPGTPVSAPQDNTVPANGFGKSVYFDNQETNRIDLGQPVALGNQTTVVLWLRNTTCVNNQIPILFNDNQSWMGDYHWHARLYLGGQEVFRYPNASICDQFVNKWRHSAYTDDGTTVKAYLDGQPLSPSVYSYKSLNGYAINRFGSRPGFGTNGMGGQIDDLAVYKRALSGQEIQTIFQNATSGLPIRYK